MKQITIIEDSSVKDLEIKINNELRGLDCKSMESTKILYLLNRSPLVCIIEFIVKTKRGQQ